MATADSTQFETARSHPPPNTTDSAEPESIGMSWTAYNKVKEDDEVLAPYQGAT